MTKSCKFNLVRLGDAKRLTRGPFGPYLEINSVRQEEPGDI